MRRHLTLSSIMAGVMGASTFPLVIAAVLASSLIAEFGVARWQIGVLATASSVVGAILAPRFGAEIDRIGAKAGSVAALAISGISLGVMATASGYGMLLAGALVSGVAQSMSNPATNKLISLHVEAGVKGVITGLKQSGVQLFTFLGGLTLPWLAGLAGWRTAVGMYAGFAFIGLGIAQRLLPGDPPDRTVSRSVAKEPLPALIWRISTFGFLLGLAGSGIFQWVPLFAQEVLGMSPQVAGGTAALAGLLGIFGRIWWGRAAEHQVGVQQSLLIISLASVLSAGCLALAPHVGGWLVWPAVFIAGLSVSSWNAVGMLAVIQGVPARQAGRASGVVMFGFLSGLGIGAPLLGYSVDIFADYRPGWVAAMGIFVVGATLVTPARFRNDQDPIS